MYLCYIPDFQSRLISVSIQFTELILFSSQVFDFIILNYYVTLFHLYFIIYFVILHIFVFALPIFINNNVYNIQFEITDIYFVEKKNQDTFRNSLIYYFMRFYHL